MTRFFGPGQSLTAADDGRPAGARRGEKMLSPLDGAAKFEDTKSDAKEMTPWEGPRRDHEQAVPIRRFSHLLAPNLLR